MYVHIDIYKESLENKENDQNLTEKQEKLAIALKQVKICSTTS